uniref:CNH domain-containing protein n=1 Tax=Schistocephalus solidus TaxID=70667 RepID=A0A183TP96_SCHSO
LESALICQRAEHIWAGSPCGLMDQLVILEGKLGRALFIDCESNECTPVLTNFSPESDSGAKVVVIDSGAKHFIGKCGYADRREECADLTNFFKVDSLRKLQSQSTQLPELIKETDDGPLFEIPRKLSLAPHFLEECCEFCHQPGPTVLVYFRWDCVGSRCFTARNLLHGPDGFW